MVNAARDAGGVAPATESRIHPFCSPCSKLMKYTHRPKTSLFYQTNEITCRNFMYLLEIISAKLKCASSKGMLTALNRRTSVGWLLARVSHDHPMSPPEAQSSTACASTAHPSGRGRTAHRLPCRSCHGRCVRLVLQTSRPPYLRRQRQPQRRRQACGWAQGWEGWRAHLSICLSLSLCHGSAAVATACIVVAGGEGRVRWGGLAPVMPTDTLFSREG